MQFTQTKLGGVVVVDIEPHTDERGLFSRVYCAEEFAEHGLNPVVSQSSISYNRAKGTLRGMHWQARPHEEDKLVRCTSGSIFDVVVDVRAGSRSRASWIGMELSASNRRALYIPAGYAHGFLTLTDQSEVLYQISVPFAIDAGRGFRWDDADVGIEWPFYPVLMSERDRLLPLLRDAKA